MEFEITGLLLGGKRKDILTDESHPEFELRTEGGSPDLVRYVLLKESGAQVWDSGLTPFSSSFQSCGIALEPKTRYALKVMAVRTEKVATTSFIFRTGFMGEKWAAKWIEPMQEDAVAEDKIVFGDNFAPWQRPKPELDGEKLRPGQELRKLFTLNKVPEKAICYATAHGVYTLFVNGKRASNVRLAPEITPYDELLYYQHYDITSLLKVGVNELGIILCDGWYTGRIGLSGASCQYGSRLSFLAQLEIAFPDGETQTIISDDSFDCRRSFIDYSDLFIGEKWDLTRGKTAWRACKAVNGMAEKLVAQPIPQITTICELKATLFTTPDGELVADFGENIAGAVNLKWKCDTRRTVILEHSESLDKSGNFFCNIIGRNKQQRDIAICGAGSYEFEPLHTYHGFRYVKISGLDSDEIKSITARSIGTPLEYTGNFICSHDGLNKLHDNIRRSMRGNLISIPTDCPQREKMGWTGDIQAFTKTGCFNAELLGFLCAWLAQMRLEQREDGEIPSIIPAFPTDDAMAREAFGNNSSAAWGDACVLIPLYLYEATGNIKVLTDNLDMMEKWLAFIERAAPNYLWRSGHQFGDWLIPSLSEGHEGVQQGVELTCEVIASSFYAITLRAWIKILDALNLAKKRIAAEDLLENVKKAVRNEYIHPDGSITGDLQGLYAIVLYAEIVEGNLRKLVANKLVQLIRDNGNRLDTGFVTTPYILDVLLDTGHKGMAYKLLFQEQMPSWMYMINKGATTIWENWTAVLTDGTVTSSSMNHYAIGSVGDWIYRNIGGIRMDAPGYGKVLFAPDFDCGLEWCKCEKLTANGLISCEWRKTDDGVWIKLQTPVNAQLIAADQQISISPGIREIQL